MGLGKSGTETSESGDASSVSISLTLLLAMLCTAVVFAVHKTKSEPTEASRLRESLWGLQFRPFSAMKKMVMAALGIIGLLALIVHAAVFLGPFASSAVVAVVVVSLKNHGLLPTLAQLKKKVSPGRRQHPDAGGHRDLKPGQPGAAPLPVWIITGFLGSGKTTLVNHLVGKGTGNSNILVIENEVGDTTLDAELVIQATGSAENVLLVNDGCVCCKVRGDLCDLLRDEVLARRLPQGKVDGVIIECSGLSDPRAVVQTFLLDEDLKHCLELREVVAVVDAAHVGHHLGKSSRADKRQAQLTRLVEEQIAFASILLLNKLDRLSNRDEASSELAELIHAVNRTAQVLQSTFCKVDISQVLGTWASGGSSATSAPPISDRASKQWLRRGAWSPSRALLEIDRVHLSVAADSADGFGKLPDDASPPSPSSSPPTPDGAVRCVSVRVSGELDLDAFNRWVLRTLADFDVLRAKGVLAVAGYEEKLAFQAVHAAFDGTPSLTARWKKGEARYSEVILIGCSLRPDLIEYGLRRCRA